MEENRTSRKRLELNVLVVDDIEIFRRHICKEIIWGNALPAASASQALKILQQEKIDAAIVDYTLPEESEREQFRSHELTLMQHYMGSAFLDNPKLTKELEAEAKRYRRGVEVL